MISSIFFDYNGDFMWASIAAIVAAAGAIGSITFAYLGYRNTKEMSKKQQAMEQKKIDADIKAKARIKWIEDVRQNSANLIKDLSNLQNYSPVDNPELSDSLVKDSELLMLYFSSKEFTEPRDSMSVVNSMPGDESSPLILRIDEKSRKQLSDTKSNESKNPLIKAYIISLIGLFKKVDVHKKIELKKEIERKYPELSFGNEDLYSTYMATNDFKDWRNINNEIFFTMRELSYFREYISIYLKIEWDRAKQGN